MVETLTLAGKLQEPQPNGPKSMKFTFQPESKPLDGYTIKRAIHRGGFGEVYYALTDAGKEVALKLLKQHFDVELRGVSQCLNLKHANLVTIFDVKKDADGDHWVIMEFVAGKSLAQVLDEYPDGMPIEDVTKWLAGMVEGLSFLHDRGIVHRDLKPGNVFLEAGVVKIGDVGLSKFISESHRSAQTQSVGTVYYMAPEVAHGRYGREVDVYSLGIVLYELLTGRVPFVGESAGEILMKHLSERPDLSPIPRRFRPILAQALEKDPLRRTPTVRQLLEDFKRAAAGYEAPQPIPEDSFIHQTMADSSTLDRERSQDRAHAATINFPQGNTPAPVVPQRPGSPNLKDIFAGDVARAIKVAEEAARRAGQIADRAYRKSYNKRYSRYERKRERWARKARRWRDQYPTFWGWHAVRNNRNQTAQTAAYPQPRPGAPGDSRGPFAPSLWHGATWFKLVIVGLVILALMPRPIAGATFEVVSTFALIGGLLYFAFWGVTIAVRGKSRGSAVPPANQTNAGISSPPGAAPAAAAVPVPNAGPGVVPVRLVGSPGVRRWTVLDPDTLRGIPLRQRVSELSLSLTYAALSTVSDRGRVVLGDRAIHRLVAGRAIRRHVVGRIVAHPGAGEVHGGDRDGRGHASRGSRAVRPGNRRSVVVAQPAVGRHSAHHRPVSCRSRRVRSHRASRTCRSRDQGAAFHPRIHGLFRRAFGSATLVAAGRFVPTQATGDLGHYPLLLGGAGNHDAVSVSNRVGHHLGGSSVCDRPVIGNLVFAERTGRADGGGQPCLTFS